MKKTGGMKNQHSEVESLWKALIVDADKQFHKHIKEALSEFSYEEKGINLLSAHSHDDAKKILQEHADIAILLIGVPINEANASLNLIKHLRNELKNNISRIIIFIPEVGTQFEKNILFTYDIHDCIEKSNLDKKNLHSTLAMALRIFRNLKDNERSKADLHSIVNTVSRFIPYKFLKLLQKESIVDVNVADHVEKDLTVLFLDIRSFTSLSEFETPLETFEFINDCLSYLEPIIVQHNGFIDKYMGDGILALFSEKADDAIEAGIRLFQSLEEYNYNRILKRQIPIKIGIGINTGLVVIGVVGHQERIECTVIGDAVNVANRIEKVSKNFGTALLISEQTLLALNNPDKFNFRSLGKIQVQGKKRLLNIFEVYNSDPEQVATLKTTTKEEFEEAVKLYQIGDYLQANRIFSEVAKRNRYDQAAKFFMEETLELIKKSKIIPPS